MLSWSLASSGVLSCSLFSSSHFGFFFLIIIVDLFLLLYQNYRFISDLIGFVMLSLLYLDEFRINGDCLREDEGFLDGRWVWGVMKWSCGEGMDERNGK